MTANSDPSAPTRGPKNQGLHRFGPSIECVERKGVRTMGHSISLRTILSPPRSFLVPLQRMKSPPPSRRNEVPAAGSRPTRRRRRRILPGGSERGATAVEYGLMVGLIAVSIIGSVTFLSGRVKGTFNRAGNAMVSVAADAGGAAVSPRQAWCTATHPGSSYYASGSMLPLPWASSSPWDGCFNSSSYAGWIYAGP